jgi:hypothetical protein
VRLRHLHLLHLIYIASGRRTLNLRQVPVAASSPSSLAARVPQGRRRRPLTSKLLAKPARFISGHGVLAPPHQRLRPRPLHHLGQGAAMVCSNRRSSSACLEIHRPHLFCPSTSPSNASIPMPSP